MLKKYIDENTVKKVSKNGYVIIDGKETGVSNLLTFLEENPKIAKENGYYPYKEIPYPEINEGEYIEETYSLVSDEIIPIFTIHKYEAEHIDA